MKNIRQARFSEISWRTKDMRQARFSEISWRTFFNQMIKHDKTAVIMAVKIDDDVGEMIENRHET